MNRIGGPFPELPRPRTHEEDAQVEVEQEQTAEAWADLHPHATLPVGLVQGDGRTIPGRYCEPCQILWTARYEPPWYEIPKRYFETWYVWVDLMTLILAALAVGLLLR